MSEQRSTTVMFLVAICALLIEHSRSVMVGAPQDSDISPETKHELLDLALKEFHRQSKSLYKYEAVDLINYKTQVVAGIKHSFTIEVAQTQCLKDNSNTVEEECKRTSEDGSKNLLCDFTVYTRAWENYSDTKFVRCTNKQGEEYIKSEPLANNHPLSMFLSFVKKHDKVYSDNREFNRRYRIFRANLKKISTLQSTEQGTGEYGVTEFADLTVKEFRQKHLGLNAALKSQEVPERQQAVIPDIALPANFDWRDYNAVTPVKNQGQCGSCWAFSVTGNVEGQYAIKHKKLISLSEQELVDCDSLDSGCQGGFMDNAYKAIENLGGLETESDYPYDGEKETCVFKKSEVKVTISGAVNISSNETKMAQWLFQNGPISIGINANAMQFYMGGVSHPLKFLCSPKGLDHGVLVVGFGVHKTSIRHRILPYWLVKNSWGPRWGEKGYYRVYRGDGTCGVNQMATSAIVD